MPLGEEGDFRSETFVQVNRFPPQYFLGGEGSPFLPGFTAPSGQSQLSFGPTGVPNFGGSTINFPGSWFDMQGPQVNFPSGTGGTTGSTNTINVDTTDDGTGNPASYTSISLIKFTGSNLTAVTNPIAGEVLVDYSGVTSGGSTLEFGRITSATPTTASPGGGAAWSYTVQLYTSGTGGSSVTARNILEMNNSTTMFYGYAVDPTSPYRTIQGSAFTLEQVPNNTFVMLISTTDLTGSSQYFFSAPNIITGTCPP